MNSTYQEMEQTDIKARLYIDAPLAAGAVIALPSDQMHYLLHVLRLNLGAAIGVFNGVDGEFNASISAMAKKQCSITIADQRRQQIYCRDLWLLFAPVKKARLDFIAQKASELGVRVIWPVKTDYCQISRVNDDRRRMRLKLPNRPNVWILPKSDLLIHYMTFLPPVTMIVF
jgi:16S rRNA (uracil1498-N3)-methyltransferase